MYSFLRESDECSSNIQLSELQEVEHNKKLSTNLQQDLELSAQDQELPTSLQQDQLLSGSSQKDHIRAGNLNGSDESFEEVVQHDQLLSGNSQKNHITAGNLSSSVESFEEVVAEDASLKPTKASCSTITLSVEGSRKQNIFDDKHYEYKVVVRYKKRSYHFFER